MKRGSIDSPEGLWLIDKPIGMSSFGVVARMRRLTNIKKIGHAGTLDPLATGLMLVLVGKTYTKQADRLVKLAKSYDMQIILGGYSSTDDAEGAVTSVSDRQPDRTEIEKAMQLLTGEIQQTPPIYSAIKVGGQRAYKLARAGKDVVIPTRTVTVSSWKLTKYDYPVLEGSADVSSGTYIRSLAHDLGEGLGVGAYLSGLRRTRVGEYSLQDAQDLTELMATLEPIETPRSTRET